MAQKCGHPKRGFSAAPTCNALIGKPVSFKASRCSKKGELNWLGLARVGPGFDPVDSASVPKLVDETTVIYLTASAQANPRYFLLAAVPGTRTQLLHDPVRPFAPVPTAPGQRVKPRSTLRPTRVLVCRQPRGIKAPWIPSTPSSNAGAPVRRTASAQDTESRPRRAASPATPMKTTHCCCVTPAWRFGGNARKTETKPAGIWLCT